MLVNIHFLIYTHLIELNSAGVAPHSNVSIGDMVKNPAVKSLTNNDESFNKLIENEISTFGHNSSEIKLNSSMFLGKSYVCFCSENAIYYNFLIYTFPW